MGADMSTLSSLISGGGGALPQIALTQSQTFVPPQDGNVCIHVIGAGGAGLSSTGTLNSGGAGGYCKKNSLAVTTSGSYTVVVGVGGPRVNSGATPVAGGNSTVAGTGLSATLTANGGGAATTNASGSGGSASNGNVNNTGGAGSNGGGGGVGVYGTGASAVFAVSAGQSDAAADGIGLSGFGQITGGNAGSFHHSSGSVGSGTFNAANGGALSGGGTYQQTNSNSNYVAGGNGGVGAGGGGCANSASAAQAWAGKGGDGLVLIQYLPS
mgnify:CR=1 FL=1|tara:strand:+ start:400 stop:1206 length:807 start_codon:yes stop_codon:yes gene_type:complete